MTQELQTFIQGLLEEPVEETIERIEAAEVVDIPFPKERQGPGCDYVMASGAECGRVVALLDDDGDLGR